MLCLVCMYTCAVAPKCACGCSWVFVCVRVCIDTLPIRIPLRADIHIMYIYIYM
jgi:hypothetical protein